MSSYWLIRLFLLVGFVLIALVIMRSVRSQSHLAMHRLSILVLLLFAVFTILFPGTLSHIVHRLGVEGGMNLLVCTLVVAFLAQLASSYRRKTAQERRITTLARAVALANTDENEPDSMPHTGVEGSHNDGGHRGCMG